MDDQVRIEEISKNSSKNEWQRPEVNELETDITEQNVGMADDGGGGLFHGS